MKRISQLISNSYDRQDFTGKKALVLAPHFDDEINIAANFLLNFCHNGGEAFVCYATNSDYAFTAEIRGAESIKACSVLGVQRDHIIVLGYGDTPEKCKNHLFYSKHTAVRSARGHERTYSAGCIVDYAMQKGGVHHEYTLDNYCYDLKCVIEEIQADIIICVDFDQHPDHKMLSLAFEKVMGGIFSQDGNMYFPQILKRFAYPLAYCAVDDYFVRNIKSTRRPVAGANDRYEFDYIDKSIYQWNERIRLPVYKTAYAFMLQKNILAKALKSYRSQYGVLRSPRIINGDEIFWERRTDNLALKAKVSVSSGNARYLNDFQLFNLSGVLEPAPQFDNYLWIPEAEDQDRKIEFTWNEPQKVSIVKIYGSMYGTGVINAVELSLDSGYSAVIGPIPDAGVPLQVDMPEAQVIRKAVVRIIDTEGKTGIAECEFLEGREKRGVIEPFIKIMIDDNFIYHYVIGRKDTTVKLNVYKYHIDGRVDVKVEEGIAEYARGVVNIPRQTKRIVLAAYAENGGAVRDCAVIERENFRSNFSFVFVTCLNFISIHISKYLNQCYRAFLYLDEQGIKYLFNKVWRKIRR